MWSFKVIKLQQFRVYSVLRLKRFLRQVPTHRGTQRCMQRVCVCLHMCTRTSRMYIYTYICSQLFQNQNQKLSLAETLLEVEHPRNFQYLEWSGFLFLDKRDQKSPIYLLLAPERMDILPNFTFGLNLLIKILLHFSFFTSYTAKFKWQTKLVFKFLL